MGEESRCLDFGVANDFATDSVVEGLNFGVEDLA